MNNEPTPGGQLEPIVGRLTPLDEACYANAEAERELEKLRADAARYRWMRERFEWRRDGELKDKDSHAFVGCRFPYLANFSCAAMLDHHIDAMMNKPPNTD